MKRILPLILAAALAGTAARAADGPGLRGTDFPTVNEAAPIAKETADDVKRERNYPDQPPVIPHAIRDYQLDLNTNKCLTCHGREHTGESQAPMISVTHFQDRTGQTLGAVAPRRYFCTQCHVPQSEAQPPVGNMFKDVDTVIRDGRAGGGGK
ncbi:MAG TPA: nitrate reductase cytochrome c-type subunit [Azospirillaceae bacterium]|nr:nitrate reductase cytochrome c-type subunit [Azospirillaceae bacterium]